MNGNRIFVFCHIVNILITIKADIKYIKHLGKNVGEMSSSATSIPQSRRVNYDVVIDIPAVLESDVGTNRGQERDLFKFCSIVLMPCPFAD